MLPIFRVYQGFASNRRVYAKQNNSSLFVSQYIKYAPIPSGSLGTRMKNTAYGRAEYIKLSPIYIFSLTKASALDIWKRLVREER